MKVNIQSIRVPLKNGQALVLENEPDCIYSKDVNIYIESGEEKIFIGRVYADDTTNSDAIDIALVKTRVEHINPDHDQFNMFRVITTPSN